MSLTDNQGAYINSPTTKQAGYLLKNHLEQIITSVFPERECLLQPGRGADLEDAVFGIYNIVPNMNYDQPYLRVDVLDVMFFSDKVDEVYQAIELILVDLNNETMFGHALNDNEDGIRFLEVNASATKAGESSLINGEDVYLARLAILFRYVKS